jgi:sugar lactone lactonase YvrE
VDVPRAWLFLVALLVLPLRKVEAQTNSAAAYTFTTLAGYNLSNAADGLGPNARFKTPVGVALDLSNNVFVADQGNGIVRKMTPAGVVTTIAGLAGYGGFADGVNSVARFWSPHAITTDTNGNVYVSDTEYYTIRQITPSGTNWITTTIAGQVGARGDGTGSGLGASQFLGPYGLAADSSGNIYVGDGGVRMLARVGNNWSLSTIANASGSVVVFSDSPPYEVTNAVAVFSGTATSIAVDGAGNLFVADQYNHTISELSPTATNWIVRTIAGLVGVPGSADGAGATARFHNPAGITVDRLGNVWVTDGNQTIRQLSPTGMNWMVSTLAGSTGTMGSLDGVGTNALFNGPFGILADSANNLILADSNNNEIRKVTSAGAVVTIAGSTGNAAGSSDGVGGGARFNDPNGVALDGAGYLYVSDSANHTIRLVTAAGVVTTIAGLAGDPGTVDGVGSNARFNSPDGIAVDGSGNLYVAQSLYADGALRRITPAGVVSTIPGVTAADVTVDKAGNVFIVNTGAVQKISLIGTNWNVSTITNVPGTLTSIAAANDGRFFLMNGHSQVQVLAPVGTNWVLSNIGPSLAFVDEVFHIAVDGADNIYLAGIDSLTIMEMRQAGTNWVLTTIGGARGGPPTYDGGYADGAGTAALFRVPYGIAVDTAGNVYVSDAANDNIRKGVFTLFTPVQATPYTQLAMSGALALTLSPPEANGQWRFPWEMGWRNSGQVASNLVAGNYNVEFRSRSGWLAIPPLLSLQITNGGLTSISTNVYYPTVLPAGSVSAGSLTVNLGATPPAGAGWRFLGDTTPFYVSGYTTNLLPGTYLVEFAGPFSGRVTPANASVQVFAGQPTVISVNYSLASTPPLGVLLPHNVAATNISNLNNYPFGFNGQLESDVGYGSGVAVQSNVVLTAAHLVFNDQNLSYVSQAYWFFQREAGVFEPQPQASRAFYALSGYAAQRTNDLQSGYTPDQSTPPSRNLDVAALYFPDPVAAGSYGGYLPSDAVPNTWLTSTASKMLVGYPVDGSLFGATNIIPGEIYQTDPQPYPLSPATDPVPGQQEVYTAPWFLSYPGNSGGPLYVQLNGYYYPAGVYLGTLFSGSQPYASAVRAIDSSVVNLIAVAQADAGTGTNDTGGGVITIIPSQVSASNPGYVQFQLAPPAAVRAGAAWRLVCTNCDTNYSTATNYTLTVASTNAISVQFRSIPGWNQPTNQSVTVQAGQIATPTALYTDMPAFLSYKVAEGLRLFGASALTYRIDYKTSFDPLVAWIPFATNTLTTNTLLINGTLPISGTRFFRAVKQ